MPQTEKYKQCMSIGKEAQTQPSSKNHKLQQDTIIYSQDRQKVKSLMAPSIGKDIES